MATKNIVPRADGEGELGTSSKKWSKVQAVTGSFDHIQTTTMTSEIYSEGSTKFGDSTDDTHIFTGSAAVYSDYGVTLQATSSTPSGSAIQHDFLTVTDSSGSASANFTYRTENPFGAPPGVLLKTLALSGSSGTDILIVGGAEDPIFGTGGAVYVEGTTISLSSQYGSTLSGPSSNISAGSYVTANTSYFLVNGIDPTTDDLLFYARPSSYGSGHSRYTSFGYDTTYDCSRFTAGYGGAGGDNQFIWYVSNDTDSEHPVMFLDFSGNLGIGTTTPAKTLDVVGNISASQEVSASSFWGDGSNLSGITATTASNADKIDVVENPAGSADFRVAFVDNIGSGYEQVYVDTGLVYNPNTEIFKVTDVEVTNAITASGIHSGPFHIHGSSVHSGTIDMYAGGGLYLYGQDGTASGSLQHSGGGVLLVGEFGVPTGIVAPNSQAFMSNGAASVEASGTDVNITPNAAGKVAVAGVLSASLGITASSFVGDGSGLTGVTGEWDGTHDGNAEITGSLIIRESDGLTIQKGNGATIGSIEQEGGGDLMMLATSDIILSASGGNIEMKPEVSGSVNVTGDFSASLGITGSEVHTPTIYATSYHAPGIGSPTYQISNLGMFIYNDLSVGLNASPDTFVVDRSEQKVGVSYDIASLPDAQFSVSGSTKLGELSTDTHQFTGSVNISGALYAGTEDPEENHQIIGTLLVDAAGTNNSEIIIDGPNPNWIMLKRSNTTVGKIATDGFNFTIYGGNSSGNTGIAAVHLYDNAQSKALTHFKPSSGISFPGTDSQVNISSSAKALRCDTDSGNNVFTVEDATTSFISGSGDLLTMDDTTAPPTPSNAAHLYAKSGEMYVMDTGGNETQISPHDEEGEWQYFSRNTRTGKVVRIRMEKMIRKLEEITGETFIEEE
tara:strand:- start:1858 stop:4557 length:2700 start_codon:yes stop_codon:yes gene_type:complete